MILNRRGDGGGACPGREEICFIFCPLCYICFKFRDGELKPPQPPFYNKASACGPSCLIEFNNCSDKLALKGNFLGNIFSSAFRWLAVAKACLVYLKK